MKSFVGYKCQEQGCYLAALYNLPTLKPGYCSKHKRTGMLNVAVRKCLSCDTKASYGYPGSSPEYCAKHKQVGTKLQPMKKCIHYDCNELALYGLTEAKYCDTHKKDGDMNLIEKECSSCHLINLIDKDALCKYCNPECWSNVRLAKQGEIEKLFKNAGYTFVCDKTIDNGECGKER